MLDGVGREELREEEEEEIWVVCTSTVSFCWGNGVGTQEAAPPVGDGLSPKPAWFGRSSLLQESRGEGGVQGL